MWTSSAKRARTCWRCRSRRCSRCPTAATESRSSRAARPASSRSRPACSPPGESRSAAPASPRASPWECPSERAGRGDRDAAWSRPRLSGRRRRAPRRRPGHRPRRDGGGRRAVGVGQVDDAQRDGHPGPAHHRQGGHRRVRGRGPVGPRAVGAAGAPHRIRLPAIPPRPRGARAGQCRRRAALHRRQPAATARTGSTGSGAGRAGTPVDPPAARAVGGEKQRTAIARAVVGEPTLLLADEPTGALDSRSGESLMRLLTELHESGTTIVVITHERQVAAYLPRQVSMLDALGTNLLTAGPGSTLFGEEATLPDDAVAMVGRIGPVEFVSATSKIADAKVYRTDRIPQAQSGGIATLAARTDLPDVVGATVASGTWLNDATAQYPAVVLGAKAAEHLGIGAAGPDMQIWLGGQWATVVGTLNPVPLAPQLDLAALVGWQAGQRYLGFDGSPTTVYTRTHPDKVETVRGVLAATINPAQPNEVEVSRPADALGWAGLMVTASTPRTVSTLSGWVRV